jgi:hypothetical protein
VSGLANDFRHISRQAFARGCRYCLADAAWRQSISDTRIRNYKIDCDVRFGYLHAALHKRQMRDLDADAGRMGSPGLYAISPALKASRCQTISAALPM